MTEVVVKQPDGQHILEFRDLDDRELGDIVQTVAKLISKSDWNYIDFEVGDNLIDD